jgi:hypothetical protein
MIIRRKVFAQNRKINRICHCHVIIKVLKICSAEEAMPPHMAFFLVAYARAPELLNP